VKFQTTYRHISDSQQRQLAEELESLAKKQLEQHLAHFEPDLVQLHAILEKSTHHKNLHRVALRLSVPGGLLTSENTADSMMAAAKAAFSELERQLVERLERMRGEDEWRRKQRRERLRRLRAAVAGRPQEERDLFRQLIRPHLPILRRFVRFELSHLRARGVLTSDDPTLDDVMDEVLARAYRKLDRHQDPREAAHWLFRIAVDVLTEEARRSRIRNRMLSLEGPPPREPTDISIDETLFDFYQPDDLVKVEDLAASPSPDPEEALTQKEIRRCFASMLANLPANWRRAVMLAQVEGMPLPAVAKVLGTSQEQVREWLEKADEYLRAELAELGIETSGSEQPLSYIARSPAAAPALEAELDEALTQSSD
jgi:ribosomal subunit interface protein